MMHFTAGPALVLPLEPKVTISMWPALLYVCTPLFLFKQLTNVVQLYVAMSDLVADDEQKRQKVG